jgi:HJR/Mrr/RecB family endonuclease
VRVLREEDGHELNYNLRSPHWVREHLRKSANPSEERLAVARRLGIFLPEGFTFVRRHRRGDMAAEVVYRSVSALRCFRMIQGGPDEHGKDAWFQFERNTAAWLKGNGYEIEQWAGSRRGDRGIDVQAKKGQNWLLVQCKFWSEHRPIGPSVIRELLGTLATFPQGASGMIVTSTRLTEGARNLCLEHGVRFCEMVDFSREISVAVP